MKYAFIALSALLMVQCSEEGDKTYPIQPMPQWSVVAEDFVSSPPSWQVAEASPVSAPDWKANFGGNAAKPNWHDPDKTVYPTSMTAVVRLSPILERLAADGDMMAAFIGGECRGVAQKVDNDGVRLYFVHVKAPSAESGNVEFRYYSSSCNRVYTSPADAVAYEIDKVYGTADAPAQPDFEQSGPYPVATKAWVRVDNQSLPFAVGSGDELQAFVGGECRGVLHVANADNMLYWFDILGKSEGETVSFRYYSAEYSQVFVSEQSYVAGRRHSVQGSETEPLVLSFVPQGSMTAYVTLDDVVARYADADNDQLAAFIGGACVGKGECVGLNAGKSVYKLVINGVGGSDRDVDLRYYSSSNGYEFAAMSCLSFADGKVEASVQSPFVVPLVVAGKHPLRMTACVTLPSDMVRYVDPSDKMAAFVGEECRGLASPHVAENGDYVFNMTINGSMDASETVVLKYYSAKNSYLYQTVGGFSFVNGGSYGTEAEPGRPGFVIVE